MAQMWMVRAGRDSIYSGDFLELGLVAIGWDELGPIEKNTTKTELLKLYKAIYPDHVDGKVLSSVSQILRFLNEIHIGDQVLTYDRDRRVYYLGDILSDAGWSSEKIPSMPRIRRVNWTHLIPRDPLGGDTKSTLGAIQTLFQVKKQAVNELNTKAIPIEQQEENLEQIDFVVSPPVVTQELVEQDVSASLVEHAEEAIEARIVRLDWSSIQVLVAGILRAMGYRTTVAPRGADRGVDVFASPDGLGLEEPRIFVEVKHHRGQRIGAQQIRSFLGGRSAGDRCLYVSTGGFTQDARYEADRSSIPLRLIGLTDLRRLLVENYEKLDEETKSLIPLKRIYVLAD